MSDISRVEFLFRLPFANSNRILYFRLTVLEGGGVQCAAEVVLHGSRRISAVVNEQARCRCLIFDVIRSFFFGSWLRVLQRISGASKAADGIIGARSHPRIRVAHGSIDILDGGSRRRSSSSFVSEPGTCTGTNGGAEASVRVKGRQSIFL